MKKLLIVMVGLALCSSVLSAAEYTACNGKGIGAFCNYSKTEGSKRYQYEGSCKADSQSKKFCSYITKTLSKIQGE